MLANIAVPLVTPWVTSSRILPLAQTLAAVALAVQKRNWVNRKVATHRLPQILVITVLASRLLLRSASLVLRRQLRITKNIGAMAAIVLQKTLVWIFLMLKTAMHQESMRNNAKQISVANMRLQDQSL